MAAQLTMQEIYAECTTGGTSSSGARKNCVTDWSELKAPPGHVFIEEQLEVIWVGRNGSENNYYIEWDDKKPVVAGIPIRQATTLRVKVQARSPKGDIGARGWTKIKFRVPIVKVQS